VLGAIDWGFRLILVTDALCRNTRGNDECLSEPLRRTGRNRHDANALEKLARKSAGVRSIVTFKHGYS
jgi:hypothetical protein